MNEMRRLIETIENIEEDMSDESFGEFIDRLKDLPSTHQRANALYLWTVAGSNRGYSVEKGLSQDDFRHLVKAIEAFSK